MIIDELSSDDTTVHEGDVVVLVCNVTGVPRPDVTWYRRPAVTADKMAEPESKMCPLRSKGQGTSQSQTTMRTQWRRQDFSLVGCTAAPSPLPALLFLLSLFPIQSPPFFPIPSPPLRSRPPSPRGSGGAISCPAGSGVDPSRKRIWCILALKSQSWWQQF